MTEKPQYQLEQRQEMEAQETSFRGRIDEALESKELPISKIDSLEKMLVIINFMGRGQANENTKFGRQLMQKGHEAVIKEFNESRKYLELMLGLLLDAKRELPKGYFHKNPGLPGKGHTAADVINETIEFLNFRRFRFSQERYIDDWEILQRILRDYSEFIRNK